MFSKGRNATFESAEAVNSLSEKLVETLGGKLESLRGEMRGMNASMNAQFRALSSKFGDATERTTRFTIESIEDPTFAKGLNVSTYTDASDLLSIGSGQLILFLNEVRRLLQRPIYDH
jgi:hypothetical protein